MSRKYPKVVFEYPVKEIHGKPCSHTDTYFAVNGFTKKPYISKLCYPSDVVSTAQVNHRTKFANASAYAVTQMTDSSKRSAAEVRFAAQSKYFTLRTFLVAEFMAGNQVE